MKYIALLLLLILVVACSPQVAEDTLTQPDTMDDMDDMEDSMDDTPDVSVTIDEETPGYDNVQKLMDEGDFVGRVKVQPTSTSVEDSYVFGVGVRNTVDKVLDLRREIIFISATDTRANSIMVDEDFMNRWIVSSPIKNVEVPGVDYLYEGLEMQVKEISEGKEAIPGSYKFRVTYKETEIVDDEAYGQAEFTIRVR